jgi:hypothetical protein
VAPFSNPKVWEYLQKVFAAESCRVEMMRGASEAALARWFPFAALES